MKKILLLALIVLVYQGQNKAALPELSIPSTRINYMAASLIAFGSGYKTATTIIDYIEKNKASVTPFVYLLIGIGGQVFLGKEPSYSEQAFYVSTFALGCYMGELSSKNFATTRTEFNSSKHQLNTSEKKIKTTRDEIVTAKKYYLLTKFELETTQAEIYALEQYARQNESDLTLYQNGLPPIVIEPSKQSEYERIICSRCKHPLLEPQGQEIVIIGLKCGDLFHQECINKWLAETPSCPVCLEPPINTSVKIIKPPHDLFEDLALYQNGLPSTVIESSEQSK